MANKNNKQKFSFKELPVYCKILRIVAAVLMCIGAIWLIIAAIVCIENPYAFGLYFGALGFLIPACAVAIVEFVLEKKWLERRQAQGDVQPQQVEEKKAESAEAPKVETKETWICPNCGEHNEGNFCKSCGSKRPEEAKVEETKPVAEKEATPVVEEPVKEAEPAKAEPNEQTGKKEIFPKFLKWLIPLVCFAFMGLLFFIGEVVNIIRGIENIVDYVDIAGENFKFTFILDDINIFFPYLFISLVCVALAIIALVKMKKPEGIVKLNSLFLLGLYIAEVLYIIVIFIYIALINEAYGGEIDFRPNGTIVAVFVLSLLGIPMCIATFILGLKPAGLVFKIANAATFGWLFIVCLVTATNSGRDFLFDKDGLVFVIFTMLLSLVLAAYPFFINVEPAAKKAK